eukprot:scaffold28279_cov134-Isochrysis_galbana.AAC.6
MHIPTMLHVHAVLALAPYSHPHPRQLVTRPTGARAAPLGVSGRLQGWRRASAWLDQSSAR